MKLKTKFQDEDFDFGEVVEANVYYGGGGRIKVITEPTKGGMITFYFESLKELNKMFEDYEEPKDLVDEWEDVPEEPVYYYFVQDDGQIGCDAVDPYNHKSKVEEHKSMGNYFGTREEAEKAVEKLKAWKRLKDKGFRFEGRYKPNYGEKFIVECSLPKETLVIDVAEDLDLLFGGEE